MSLFAVHRLTETRDRHKAISTALFEIDKLLDAISTAARLSWSDNCVHARAAASVEAIARIQILGANCQRLRRMTPTGMFGDYFWPVATIDLGDAVKQLRKAITEDPFTDPTHAADRSKMTTVEGAIGVFRASLAAEFNSFGTTI